MNKAERVIETARALLKAQYERHEKYRAPFKYGVCYGQLVDLIDAVWDYDRFIGCDE